MKARECVLGGGAFVLALVLTSCGGGGGSAGGQTGGSNGGSTGGTFSAVLGTSSPKFEDGSSYASLDLTGTGSGTSQIKASSTAFDAFLSVEKMNADGTYETVSEDDDSGGGTDAAVALSVSGGVHYRVLITGVSPTSAGTCTVSYDPAVLSR